MLWWEPTIIQPRFIVHVTGSRHILGFGMFYAVFAACDATRGEVTSECVYFQTKTAQSFVWHGLQQHVQTKIAIKFNEDPGLSQSWAKAMSNINAPHPPPRTLFEKI